MGLFSRKIQASGLCPLDNCNNSERSSRRFFETSKQTLSNKLGHKELTSGHFWLSILSECLSCYLYVFVVCSTRISWTGAIIGHEPNLLAMSLSSGIAMMLLITTFRTVHINPALTISFFFTGRIPFIRAILYIIVQCIGSVAAIAFLYSISIKGHAGSLGLDNPHENLFSWQILIIELVISFVVTMATYATCNYSSYAATRRYHLERLGKNDIAQQINSTNPIFSQSHHQYMKNTLQFPSYNNTRAYDCEYDNRAFNAPQAATSQVPLEETMQDESQILAPNGFSLHVTTGQAFIIGLAYTLTSLSGIPASGASLNPARSFGPAFIMNRWDHHWIYWLGPILGAVIAGFLYEFVFNPTSKSSLCYRPKLFRFSAHDMAKFGSKSRLYQQRVPLIAGQLLQENQPPTNSISTIYRPQNHHMQQHSQSIHITPTTITGMDRNGGVTSASNNLLYSAAPLEARLRFATEPMEQAGMAKQLVYEDPKFEQPPMSQPAFRLQSSAQTSMRRPLNFRPPLQSLDQQRGANNSFSTLATSGFPGSPALRPLSMAPPTGSTSCFVKSQHNRRSLMVQPQMFVEPPNEQHQQPRITGAASSRDEELDDGLYNVLSESNEDQTSYANNKMAPSGHQSSDSNTSSQRTNEMRSISASGPSSQILLMQPQNYQNQHPVSYSNYCNS